jgi:hypothetical protein
MHSHVAVVATLISIVVFTDPALAKKVTIGGTHSRGEIRGKCAAQGGLFTNEKGGGYTCYAKNSVTCDAKGKCSGSVPGRQVPKGGRTGVIGGAAKTVSFGATRIGGTQATHGALPRSAATVRPCARHHC